jgi:hypothetical protein
MTGVFGAILFVLWIFSYTLTVKSSGTWLSTENKSKREFEIFALGYSVVWVSVFGYVIVTQAYEQFNEVGVLTHSFQLTLYLSSSSSLPPPLIGLLYETMCLSGFTISSSTSRLSDAS